ncbi:MAG: beta-ketoacyl-ACP synthase III [Thermaurantiacus tibetensis]|uniref:beta-ketoacyl-ACP synthase III n=1 Tax=Thermaurantiacus tibetensis TaxID=2759035 RepID=UPI00188F5DBF|nr:beta-ketoacyl-ACP synthase III [Thermaurantiacus tibetensis]
MPRSVLLGTGSALPATRVTNDDLAARLDTSDAWIRERTGIVARRIADASTTTADLATEAAAAALAAAGLPPQAIDLVLVATATPDLTFPATAVRVQARLGIAGGPAFDVAAVCSGFVYALGVADSMLRAGQATRALVIGAETFSRLLDWEDRSTAVLFGDGAGAVVLERRDPPEADDVRAARGLLAIRLHADGRHEGLLHVDGGPGSTGTVGKLRMAGREVFRHAVHNLASVCHEVLEETGLPIAAIDWVVPHQANLRIIEATARKLGLPMERVVVTVHEHANTSAASIPLALDAAVRDGRIREGQLCLLEAMGGGFTWGAALLRV